MFEQTFKNIDDVLWKEAGCATELDYTEQTSWILFLKYLDELERANEQKAELIGKKYAYIIDKAHRWSVDASAVGGEGKTRLQFFGIGLGLRDALGVALVTRFGLDHRQLVITENQDIVGDLRFAAPACTLDAAGADRLASDPAVGDDSPPRLPQRGVDQLGAGLGLVHSFVRSMTFLPSPFGTTLFLFIHSRAAKNLPRSISSLSGCQFSLASRTIDSSSVDRPSSNRLFQAAKTVAKERAIQHMMATSYWSPDGKPISANQMVEKLFGELPRFFKDEEELRKLWSQPATRNAVLEGLADKGFGPDQLQEISRIVNAEKSDVFDVLAYVAFALAPITRLERVETRKADILGRYDAKLQAFLDFVLAQYLTRGVGELDQEKLGDLLQLKYHTVDDAAAQLGDVSVIRDTFVGFQQYLYAPRT